MNLLPPLAVALLTGALLSGCAPTPGPSPAPSPLPSFQCTPEAGGDAFPCTERQHQDMLAKDALYAEAEEVYRKLFAEEVRLYREGAPISPEIAKYARGAYLLATEARHAEQASLGHRSEGDYRLAHLGRNPGLSKSGSLVSLVACVDGSEVVEMKGQERLGTGNVVLEELYFVREDSRLKVDGFVSKAVDQC